MSRRWLAKLEPWMFLAPALFLLVVYLVYPAIHTVLLSLFNQSATHFVGLRNYAWALHDPEFLLSIRNNLLWLIVAPLASIVLGFIIAGLADNVGWGALAKSLVFMPMAISFVGASVIWKFVYDFRAAGQNQIGVLNALVVALGGEPQAWITIPFWNNLFLIVILVWMQTGFAVVMFSAAMRGVSNELLESARIDGANEIQVFIRIILPQIWGTIVVVWTTFTVDVLKVFDIVIAMTNGQWDTNVLANMMYNWMFRGGGDYGRGSMLATLIMIAVIPIMLWNIRRFRAEEMQR